MKYTDEQILTYAKGQLAWADRQKWKKFNVGFFAAVGLFLIGLLFWEVVEHTERLDGTPFLDARFISGVVFGIALLFSTGLSLLGCLSTSRFLQGKQIGVCRLLLKWHQGRNEAVCNPTHTS